MIYSIFYTHIHLPNRPFCCVLWWNNVQCVSMCLPHLGYRYSRHDPFASWWPPIRPKHLLLLLLYYVDVDLYLVPSFAITLFESGDIGVRSSPPKVIFKFTILNGWIWLDSAIPLRTPPPLYLYHPIFVSYTSLDYLHVFYWSLNG